MADTFDIQQLIEESAKERFDELDGSREDILEEARKCAKLTLPYVLPEEGHRENDGLDNPYQNVGAKLVNNLASKITFAMLPPNSPFFRLFTEEGIKEEYTDEKGQPTEELKEIEKLAVTIENEAQKTIAKQALIVPTVEIMKALIITGNSLAVKVEPESSLEKGLKIYRLDNYVVLRDYRGNLVEVITKETVSPYVLDEDIIELLDIDITQDTVKDVSVYTRAVLREGKWYEYQGIEGETIPDSDKTYTLENFPYMALRTTFVNGHNYGLGIVTQHLGDFISLESANQLILEASSVMARVLFGLKAGSVADIDEINSAGNGDVVIADFENDFTTLRTDKQTDLQFVMEVKREIERRLEQVFLAANSAIRDSDRTTATEVRYLANDLEVSQGGLYSLLSQEFQAPLARLLLEEMSVDMRGYDYVPITGVEALGRNNDRDKLREFSGIIQETPILQEAIGQYFNASNYIEDITIASNLPSGRYTLTEEQVAEKQKAMQEQQVAMQGIGGMAEEAGRGAGKNLSGQQKE